MIDMSQKRGLRGDRQIDVMIQDVNPLNAHIYFDGHMYVGGCKHLPSPSHFAPYFTIPAANDPTLPHVEEAGVSWISEVVTVRKVTVRELQRHPESAIDETTHSDSCWQRWRQGLQAIAKRAREEPFRTKLDPHYLYFLSVPAALGRMIKKAPRQTRLRHGFGRQYFELATIQDLGARTRR